MRYDTVEATKLRGMLATLRDENADLRALLAREREAVRGLREVVEQALRYFETLGHPESCGCIPWENFYEPECAIAMSFHAALATPEPAKRNEHFDNGQFAAGDPPIAPAKVVVSHGHNAGECLECAPPTPPEKKERP
jgi:hypothetical protein